MWLDWQDVENPYFSGEYGFGCVNEGNKNKKKEEKIILFVLGKFRFWKSDFHKAGQGYLSHLFQSCFCWLFSIYVNEKKV